MSLLKPVSYYMCIEAVQSALLDTPHHYAAFTEYFNLDALDKVVETFGQDLTNQCKTVVLSRLK